MVVVYDPDGGFVTGGGWTDSPAGSCQYSPACTDVSGHASFGFVSKYKKGKTTPNGQTNFLLVDGDFHFHSSSYEALIVTTHDARAQFWGTGTINGSGEYLFKVWITDGSLLDPEEPDNFRIKIWTEDGSGETVIYDNGIDQEIGDGQIVIHVKKGKK